MYGQAHSHRPIFKMGRSSTKAALTTLLWLSFLISGFLFFARTAQAQTYQVIHSFTGGADGAAPAAGLVMDAAGNLYGTTQQGGFSGRMECPNGCGTVFQLSKLDSAWILTPVYRFTGKPDGYYPSANLVFGPDGSLYGTTRYGGVPNNCIPVGCGTVFKVTSDDQGRWTESVLHRFEPGSEGYDPFASPVAFDSAGDIYVTTEIGGPQRWGSVIELTPSANGWIANVVHAFGGPGDGQDPTNGAILDSAGNLYGTTYYGLTYGSVFELSPSGSGWTETILHNFQDTLDGASPQGGLIFDRAGNLYGMTAGDGHGYRPGGSGTVFMLSPANGNWTLHGLYSFFPRNGIGAGPQSLMMDGAGNLYGTTVSGGAYSAGNVFKLTPENGGWTYTSLHDFTGGSDGCSPEGGLIIDANGNLYGTANSCGLGYGLGVVFEITP